MTSKRVKFQECALKTHATLSFKLGVPRCVKIFGNTAFYFVRFTSFVLRNSRGVILTIHLKRIKFQCSGKPVNIPLKRVQSLKYETFDFDLEIALSVKILGNSAFYFVRFTEFLNGEGNLLVMSRTKNLSN